MADILLQYSDNPLLVALAVILISWVWEDAAVVSGALFAADMIIPVPLAVTAVLVGICSGDMGLYYMGRLAVQWRPLRSRILLNPRSRELRRRFRQRMLSNIMAIRFLPGLRTLGFTLCGLWRVSPIRFFTAMLLAGAAWIGVIFTLVYTLGTSEWLVSSGPWKWSLMLIAGALFLINNLRAGRKKL